MRIVLDTNVLVSGLLRPEGPPGRVVDGLLTESYRALFDDRIMSEYTAVLARPRFSFDVDAVKVLLSFLRDTGELIPAASLMTKTVDPGDQPFLEVAVAGMADALVTGNLRHFPAGTAVRIVSPAEFLTAGSARRS